MKMPYLSERASGLIFVPNLHFFQILISANSIEISTPFSFIIINSFKMYPLHEFIILSHLFSLLFRLRNQMEYLS